VLAMSDPTPTGVDAQTSMLLGFPGGRQAVLHSVLDARGPVSATVIGTEGRIEIDRTWYAPTSFTLYDATDQVVERYESRVDGRGMQFQALELERLVAEGPGDGDRLPIAESVAIMGTLDEVRRQIGLVYPGE
jgi:predicted dehydrogenase